VVVFAAAGDGALPHVASFATSFDEIGGGLRPG